MCCINADGAGACVLHTMASFSPSIHQPWPLGCGTAPCCRQVFQRWVWKLLRRTCWNSASWVGGKSSYEVRDAWQNKLYRTSLTEVASTLPYSLHTNRSQSSKRLLGTSKSWPSNCMACPSPLARSLKATFLPRRPNELTESHPVKAWKPGSASKISAPRGWESWLRLKHRVCWPAPVWRSKSHGSFDATQRPITATSVSKDFTTTELAPLLAAWEAWRNMRVSASSWLE